MAGKLEIINMALGHVGVDPVTSETGSSSCNTFYDNTIDQVLTNYKFRASQFRAKLVASSEAPVFGYSYKYQLPQGADQDTPHCLRVLELSIHGHYYTVTNRFLETDLTPVSILYAARPAGLGNMDANFFDIAAVELALKIAVLECGAKNARSIRQDLRQYLKFDIKPVAYAVDSFQTVEPDQRHTNEGVFLAARRGFRRHQLSSQLEII